MSSSAYLPTTGGAGRRGSPHTSRSRAGKKNKKRGTGDSTARRGHRPSTSWDASTQTAPFEFPAPDPSSSSSATSLATGTSSSIAEDEPFFNKYREEALRQQRVQTAPADISVYHQRYVARGSRSGRKTRKKHRGSNHQHRRSRSRSRGTGGKHRGLGRSHHRFKHGDARSDSNTSDGNHGSTRGRQEADMSEADKGKTNKRIDFFFPGRRSQEAGHGARPASPDISEIEALFPGIGKQYRGGKGAGSQCVERRTMTYVYQPSAKVVQRTTRRKPRSKPTITQDKLQKAKLLEQRQHRQASKQKQQNLGEAEPSTESLFDLKGHSDSDDENNSRSAFSATSPHKSSRGMNPIELRHLAEEEEAAAAAEEEKARREAEQLARIHRRAAARAHPLPRRTSITAVSTVGRVKARVQNEVVKMREKAAAEAAAIDSFVQERQSSAVVVLQRHVRGLLCRRGWRPPPPGVRATKRLIAQTASVEAAVEAARERDTHADPAEEDSPENRHNMETLHNRNETQALLEAIEQLEAELQLARDAGLEEKTACVWAACTVLDDMRKRQQALKALATVRGQRRQARRRLVNATDSARSTRNADPLRAALRECLSVGGGQAELVTSARELCREIAIEQEQAEREQEARIKIAQWLQRRYRGAFDRRLVLEMQSTATKVQAMWRGKKARVRSAKKRQEADDDLADIFGELGVAFQTKVDQKFEHVDRESDDDGESGSAAEVHKLLRKNVSLADLYADDDRHAAAQRVALIVQKYARGRQEQRRFLQHRDTHMRRRDPDNGEFYTRDEFIRHYGGTDEWEAALVAQFRWQQSTHQTNSSKEEQAAARANSVREKNTEDNASQEQSAATTKATARTEEQSANAMNSEQKNDSSKAEPAVNATALERQKAEGDVGAKQSASMNTKTNEAEEDSVVAITEAAAKATAEKAAREAAEKAEQARAAAAAKEAAREAKAEERRRRMNSEQNNDSSKAEPAVNATAVVQQKAEDDVDAEQSAGMNTKTNEAEEDSAVAIIEAAAKAAAEKAAREAAEKAEQARAAAAAKEAAREAKAEERRRRHEAIRREHEKIAQEWAKRDAEAAKSSLELFSNPQAPIEETSLDSAAPGEANNAGDGTKESKSPAKQSEAAPSDELEKLLRASADGDAAAVNDLLAAQDPEKLALLAKHVATPQQQAHSNYHPLSMSLHAAILGGHADVVAKLLDHGGPQLTESVHPAESGGSTALHTAIRCQNDDVVQVLLARKADPHMECVNGATAAEATIFRGTIGALKMLIDHGEVNPMSARPSDGNTLLMLAAYEGRFDMLKELMVS